ncbi:hypothetical protein L596_023483 [Steinernema carpocapsae]|uniref:Uncharacterized protein n=1 Tax=Steinernema carpocapsae TaxID=34508 RepID=A0A4U5MDT9_STECR|nr:hypothetical protein L596_023483 [Steinernema carpocapsae]
MFPHAMRQDRQAKMEKATFPVGPAKTCVNTKNDVNVVYKKLCPRPWPSDLEIWHLEIWQIWHAENVHVDVISTDVHNDYAEQRAVVTPKVLLDKAKGISDGDSKQIVFHYSDTSGLR